MTEVRCESCHDELICKDDEYRSEVMIAISKHILKGSFNIHHTSHGTFTMVDGQLFEEAIW